MLEGQSCLISRALPSSCEQESKWVYMTYQFLEVSSGKRPPAEDLEARQGHDRGKRKKSPDLPDSPDQETERPPEEPNRRGGDGRYDQPEDPDGHGGADEGDDLSEDPDGHGGADEGDDLSEDPDGQGSDGGRNPPEDSDAQGGDGHEGDGEYNDSNSLLNPIGRDLTIICLARCSRSDYGTFCFLNRGFRSVIRTGELYKLRRKMGITEHWVYLSCNVLEWVAYDPFRDRWMTLPKMSSDECFMCSDKESLAVGTELLVFGKEFSSYIVLSYSILTHSWSPGIVMNSPRCLFGSASLGEKAIVAGGTDAQGNILSTAELYNSEKQTWVTLPSMNKPRKMCSGVFMDRKFYVIGGMASNTELLTCGEEYDLERGVWRVIPYMSDGLNGPSSAPPLVAVINNELYAADYAQKEVRKYNKKNNSWITLGRLPERSDSMNGWGLAFRACGERLIVISGPRGSTGGLIELNSWIPNEGPPEWKTIATKQSGSFVYNCAVMGC